MKILVAEDSHQSLYLLDQYFTSRGHTVWPAENGAAALALCRERGAPDVIVSDALMPQLDGFGLCDALRRDPVLAGVPFILYTATYTAESDERFALSIGVDRFVIKPIEPAELLAIVNAVAAQVHQAPPRAPRAAEPQAELLQEYARLVSVKLEEKLADLSRAHAALQSSEEAVRNLNERLLASVRRLELEIEERRRTAELLRLAQQVGGTGTWECDGAEALRWSEEAAALLGGPAGAPPTAVPAFLAALAAEDRPGATEVLLGPPEASVNEVEIRYGPPGAVRHFLLRGGRPDRSERTPLRRIGIVQDVTARKEAEARRQSLEVQLINSQKMEALGNLAGGIAHDFNNILTGILGSAEILKFELPRLSPPPDVTSSVNVIVDAAHRARDIIQQILTFSRRQPVERAPLRFSRLVESALRLVRSTVGRAIEVRSQIDSDRYVIANESQIHQVLLNLCTNAAHAMGADGGVISVAVANVEVTAAEAALHPGLRPGPYVRLDVADTGTGIEPSVREHLFEPFFTTKAVGEGTGLGLAVVHGIVQAHDGVITLESRFGHGTTFSLYFPAASAQEASAARRTADYPRGEGQRVLVVDDEPSVARTCAKLLEQLGYRATALTDAVAAREAFDRDPQSYDAAIVDFLMPRLTGVDLARALWIQRPQLPVILVAGFGGQMDAARARAEGFRDLLGKPFTLASLGEAVGRATRQP
jgi:signal transduction histidine kinase/DNA-binding response OmpR family regulator